MERVANVTLGSASANWNDPSRVTYTGTTFSYDFGSEAFVPSDFVRLDITTGPSAVPEPSTLLLLGIGFASLVGYGWRRRKQTALEAVLTGPAAIRR